MDMLAPAVVAGVDPRSPLSQDELFGPAVAVSSAEDWESAIAQANGTPYGRDDRHQNRHPAWPALVTTL
jgi:acyl-CoA reductase-like NAD-dependent aldehyde dehydrogenase